MEKLEKLVSVDNCMVCGLLMSHENKNDLTLATSYSQKPIFQLIGK
jgi:hypothetical protein